MTADVANSAAAVVTRAALTILRLTFIRKYSSIVVSWGRDSGSIQSVPDVLAQRTRRCVSFCPRPRWAGRQARFHLRPARAAGFTFMPFQEKRSPQRAQRTRRTQRTRRKTRKGEKHEVIGGKALRSHVKVMRRDGER